MCGKGHESMRFKLLMTMNEKKKKIFVCKKRGKNVSLVCDKYNR